MTGAARAFRFGFTSSVLLWATVNALSYFLRSDGWGNLLGARPGAVEAIGVPWVIWAEGAGYGAHFLSYAAMLGDTLVAVASSVALGCVATWFYRRGELPPIDQALAAPTDEATRRFQFSLRAMLITTAAVSMVLSMVRAQVDALAILLLSIYLFGPSAMLIVAHRSRRIVPAERGLLLSATGLILVVAAAVLGEMIEGIGDFTRGIMGIFVCWVPQCLLILVAVLVWQRIGHRRIARSGTAP